MSNYRNFKDYHIEQLRDPENAKIYLSVALEDYEKDGDIEAFLLSVRDVVEARDSMAKLTERVG
jgi:DNA-binding phage protein